MASLIPATSVEFQTLTTIPTWGEQDDKKDIPGQEEFINLKTIFLQDLRLGNISHRYDDIEYLEDRIGLAHNLLILRGGDFKSLAPIPLRQVGETTELSHSRGGFFRKNAQTIHSEESSTIRDETNKKGFFGGLFGGGGKK